jgi:hypothetical protein
MSHPSLGLPPADATAGHAEVAARLRQMRTTLARRALEQTLRLDPSFSDRNDEVALRLLLRDFEQHVVQLARALETGQDWYVVQYGEWLVPIYRRRHVSMRDFRQMLAGLREAARPALPREEAQQLDTLIERWQLRLRRHARLPGDHKGNPIVRFLWKGAGIGDESVV